MSATVPGAAEMWCGQTAIVRFCLRVIRTAMLDRRRRQHGQDALKIAARLGPPCMESGMSTVDVRQARSDSVLWLLREVAIAAG